MINEAFLHDLWKKKRFKDFNFYDVEGNSIEILDFGTPHHNSGPDFELAKIKNNDVILFGNVELHVKSSDWYLHGHQKQREYDSVILHVVYEHDKEVLELKKAGIPTLELKNHIDPNITSHKETFSSFIPCERVFSGDQLSGDIFKGLLFQKLEEKSEELDALLLEQKNDYEAVLFQKMAYAFGLKVNAELFQEMAKHLDFNVVQKTSQNQLQLESLFLGKAGLLSEENSDALVWRKEFDFLKAKFNLSEVVFKPKFLRLRPSSFPNIRWSQLASLYHLHPKLFSKIIATKKGEDLKPLFKEVAASPYWESHFVFGKKTAKPSRKPLSKAFIELLMINAILPMIYHYLKKNNMGSLDSILEHYTALAPEENRIINNWKALNVNIPSALESQACLYLYKNFCKRKRCLHCPTITK